LSLDVCGTVFMAFVCILAAQTEADAVIDVSKKGTNLVFPIGYDDVDGSAYQLFVSFDVAPGGIIEYSFCIVRVHSNGVGHDFWDSQVIANMISSSDRRMVRALLLDATRKLVDDTLYPEVTMHTFNRNLPPKALAKYRLIAQIFRDAGYGIRETERQGQHIWWFKHHSAVPRRKRRRRRW
jgi:hypothetical protein